MCFIGWGAHNVFYWVSELLMCFIVWGAPNVFYWVGSFQCVLLGGELTMCFIGRVSS